MSRAQGKFSFNRTTRAVNFVISSTIVEVAAHCTVEDGAALAEELNNLLISFETVPKVRQVSCGKPDLSGKLTGRLYSR